MKRKIISVLLTLCLLLALPINSSANSGCFEEEHILKLEEAIKAEAQNRIESIDYDRLENEGRANDLYNTLLDIMMEDTESEDFPDYYGGAYINELGNLVFCICETSGISITEGIKKLIEENDLETVCVDLSYYELLEYQNTVENRINEARASSDFDDIEHKLLESIGSISKSIEENKLIIRFNGTCSDEYKEVFFELFKNIRKDKVRFVDGGNITFTAAAWKPGHGICRQTSPNTVAVFSTGYPVYFTDSSGSTLRGFITAGHAIGVNNLVYRINDDDTIVIDSTHYLGPCMSSQCTGGVDAALVKINTSSYQMSATTYYDGITLSSSYYSVPAVGTSIRKEGFTTHYATGYVTDTSASITINNITLSGMIETTANNQSGDSGGPMYMYNSTLGAYTIVGSMSSSYFHAGSGNWDSDSRSYATKVGNTLSAFGCSIWQ